MVIVAPFGAMMAMAPFADWTTLNPPGVGAVQPAVVHEVVSSIVIERSSCSMTERCTANGDLPLVGVPSVSMAIVR